ARDARSVRGRRQGPRRRAEPDPTHEAAVGRPQGGGRHQPPARPRHPGRGGRRAAHRRPGPPQDLRARRAAGRPVGDPARAQGDWGSRLLAMGGEVVAQGPGGSRTIPLTELFEGPFMTSLEPTEILTEVRVPDPGPSAGGTYLKLERKVGDFATVGVAVHLSVADGRVGRAGIALTAVGPTNLRATAAEEALAGSDLTDELILEAAEMAARAAHPYSDTRGSADYKRQVVQVFTERGLRSVATSLGASVEAGPRGPVTSEASLDATRRQDYFSGERTLAGVFEELEEKPGGPD